MSAVIGAGRRASMTGVEWLPVAAGLLALYVPTFVDLAATRWQQEDQSHGPIVLAVILWLLWERRRVLLEAAGGALPVAGFGLLACGVLVYAFGRSQDIVLLEVGSLLPVLIGTVLATRGGEALRALWFAMLFIAFLVPLPALFIDALTLPLKQGVSVVVEQLLYAAGYPIARTGVVLVIGQYQLLVADACSGLNSMFSLSAMGTLYLYLMKRPGWLHNGLLLAAILPIAFCANIIRVVALVLITYYFGDEAGQGFLHGFSSLVLFISALLALIGLDALLRLAGAPWQRRAG